MDVSDEENDNKIGCYSSYDMHCEDKLCPPYFFSCGNGFCYDGPNMINSLCPSQRDRLYFNNMSPSKLIIFSHIITIYNDLTSVTICFNKTLCPHLFNKHLTFTMDGLTCQLLNTLTNHTYTDVDDMLRVVRHLVLSCSASLRQYHLSNTSTLFQCDDNITFISKYRLSDGHQDCSNGDDEHPDTACAFNLPYRFMCDLGTRCIPVSLIGNSIVSHLLLSTVFVPLTTSYQPLYSNQFLNVYLKKTEVNKQ